MAIPATCFAVNRSARRRSVLALYRFEEQDAGSESPARDHGASLSAPKSSERVPRAQLRGPLFTTQINSQIGEGLCPSCFDLGVPLSVVIVLWLVHVV
jgi:hypothetical protein